METELFGLSTCPYTSDLREWLIADARAFVEYDVEQDAAARQRLLGLTGGGGAVPVLVEDGHVVRVGWLGRSCMISVGITPGSSPGVRR